MSIIQNPTWQDILAMINATDISSMKHKGLDLENYEEVSALGHKIYYYLAYKIMPKSPESNAWTDDQIATYNNWLIAGMPKDTAHYTQIIAERNSTLEQTSNRVRKDIETLDDTEIKNLKAAFQGLMDRDPKSESEYDIKEKCYFSLAGKHWFPAPTFCQHHIYSFLSWHRWQMLDFENALRSVKGCEDVTLPYWNIETGVFPQLISEAPFNEYEFPINVYPKYYTPSTNVGKKNTKTQRFPYFMQLKKETTKKQVKKYRAMVNHSITTARTALTFAHFNGIDRGHQYNTPTAIMKAHDMGHSGSGKTMSNQDIAAFDPMFWFFHCNWDRLWWEWQVSRNATTLESFKKTLEKNDDQRWLTDPQMSISDPFRKSNSDSVDLNQQGISYANPKPIEKLFTDNLPLAMAPTWRDQNEGQSTRSSFTFKQDNLNRVSLRVKGVNRIKIPGSFWVILYLNDEEVGRDSFFQSTFSGDCENCVQQAKINFDFVFDRSHLTDAKGNPKEIKVEIVNVITDEIMPFDKIGNPTINIRMLH